jgi:hypothetical protein
VKAYVQKFRAKHGDAQDAVNPSPDVLARDVFCQGLSNQYVAGELNPEIFRDLHMTVSDCRGCVAKGPTVCKRASAS